MGRKRTAPFKGRIPLLLHPNHRGSHCPLSAATASGGLGILFVSAIPAMYRLGLLSELPQKDFGKLLALVFSAGFFGVFFAIPLRHYYIIKQKLTFPTPSATVSGIICCVRCFSTTSIYLGIYYTSTSSRRCCCGGSSQEVTCDGLLVFQRFRLQGALGICYRYCKCCSFLFEPSRLRAISRSMIGTLAGRSTALASPARSPLRTTTGSSSSHQLSLALVCSAV